MKDLKYYEVELWRDYKDENGKIDGGITDYSLCIKGVREPSVIEAEHFLESDIKALGYEGVTRVIEISEEEAYDEFNMENVVNWKIFGEEKTENKKENEEMKNTIRIIDKAITFTKKLTSFLDEELRTTNLKLAQEFEDEIEILYNLEDKLYEVENNLYNPPKKVEFTIIGVMKESKLYGELYSSTDIQDVLKKAKDIAYLCDNKTLRNSYGDPYDYLEVVQRDNHDVVYWRSYEEVE